MSQKLLDFTQPFKNIVWDWNGTLLNDLDVVMQVEAEHFPHYGITPPSLELRNQLFCFPVQKYYEKLGFDFTQHAFSDVNNHFHEIYERLLLETPLFEGSHQILGELQAQNKRQFVLSAASQAHLEEITKRRQVQNYFQGIYGLAHNDADTKVGRGRELIAEHALIPSETLMIGDTAHDFEVGRELGFEVLLIADGHNPYERLVQVHPHVLRSRY